MGTTDAAEQFPAIVRSTTEWGYKRPFAVVDVVAVPLGFGPQEENRPVIVPLDPRFVSELQQRLLAAPTIDLPWNPDADYDDLLEDEQLVLAHFDGTPVVVHQPLGVLSLDGDTVTYCGDVAVPSLIIEPRSSSGQT